MTDMITTPARNAIKGHDLTDPRTILLSDSECYPNKYNRSITTRAVAYSVYCPATERYSLITLDGRWIIPGTDGYKTRGPVKTYARKNLATVRPDGMRVLEPVRHNGPFEPTAMGRRSGICRGTVGHEFRGLDYVCGCGAYVSSRSVWREGWVIVTDGRRGTHTVSYALDESHRVEYGTEPCAYDAPDPVDAPEVPADAPAPDAPTDAPEVPAPVDAPAPVAPEVPAPVALAPVYVPQTPETAPDGTPDNARRLITDGEHVRVYATGNGARLRIESTDGQCAYTLHTVPDDASPDVVDAFVKRAAELSAVVVKRARPVKFKATNYGKRWPAVPRFKEPGTKAHLRFNDGDVCAETEAAPGVWVPSALITAAETPAPVDAPEVPGAPVDAPAPVAPEVPAPVAPAPVGAYCHRCQRDGLVFGGECRECGRVDIVAAMAVKPQHVPAWSEGCCPMCYATEPAEMWEPYPGARLRCTECAEGRSRWGERVRLIRGWRARARRVLAWTDEPGVPCTVTLYADTPRDDENGHGAPVAPSGPAPVAPVAPVAPEVPAPVAPAPVSDVDRARRAAEQWPEALKAWSLGDRYEGEFRRSDMLSDLGVCGERFPFRFHLQSGGGHTVSLPTGDVRGTWGEVTGAAIAYVIAERPAAVLRWTAEYERTHRLVTERAAERAEISAQTAVSVGMARAAGDVVRAFAARIDWDALTDDEYDRVRDVVNEAARCAKSAESAHRDGDAKTARWCAGRVFKVARWFHLDLPSAQECAERAPEARPVGWPVQPEPSAFLLRITRPGWEGPEETPEVPAGPAPVAPGAGDSVSDPGAVDGWESKGGACPGVEVPRPAADRDGEFPPPATGDDRPALPAVPLAIEGRSAGPRLAIEGAPVRPALMPAPCRPVPARTALAVPYTGPRRVYAVAPVRPALPAAPVRARAALAASPGVTGRAFWESGERVTYHGRPGRTTFSRIGGMVRVVWDDSPGWQGSDVPAGDLWAEGHEPQPARVIAPPYCPPPRVFALSLPVPTPEPAPVVVDVPQIDTERAARALALVRRLRDEEHQEHAAPAPVPAAPVAAPPVPVASAPVPVTAPAPAAPVTPAPQSEPEPRPAADRPTLPARLRTGAGWYGPALLALLVLAVLGAPVAGGISGFVLALLPRIPGWLDARATEPHHHGGRNRRDDHNLAA